MNDAPDIYELASFSWFQWSWFFGESLKSKQLCRCLGPAHGVGQEFCSYILTGTGIFISLSSVITIDEHELTTNNITKQCKNSMERVEAKIGNSKKPMFDVTEPDRVYYSDFGYTDYADNNVLPYGGYIQDHK